MTLVKFKDPFPSFIDEFFGGDIFDSMNQSVIRNSLPAVNIKENENQFSLELAAPGMKKGDFKIELNNNLLKVSSETQEETEEEKDKYTRREFKYSSFKRSFTLPEGVDSEKINASYSDGVLQIEIPKIKKENRNTSKLIDIS